MPISTNSIIYDILYTFFQRLADSGCLYAVCQGAIGAECRADDKETLAILDSITDKKTMLQCIAERSFIRNLVGGITQLQQNLFRLS